VIMRTILENHRYEVTAVSSGREALERLATEAIDLVLLDVMMPEMSGLDILQRMKENPAMGHVPVIMVTAKTQDEDLMNGYQFGADYYITKPFTAKQLLYGIDLTLGNAEPAA